MRGETLQLTHIIWIQQHDIGNHIKMITQMLNKPNRVRCQLMHGGVLRDIRGQCARTHTNQICAGVAFDKFEKLVQCLGTLQQTFSSFECLPSIS